MIELSQVENPLSSQKSDIWAVGCILYELMTLKRAFEAGNLPALVTKIMRADYQPPPPKYSSQARSLVSKCLSLELGCSFCQAKIISRSNLVQGTTVGFFQTSQIVILT